MFLGAMAGIGVDFNPLQEAFNREIAGLNISVSDAWSFGIRGKRVRVLATLDQPMRHLEDLTHVINRLAVSNPVKTRLAPALCRLAEVEAHVDGIPIGHVHFHELGTIDTLVDVIGALWAQELLTRGETPCAPEHNSFHHNMEN